MSFPIGDVVKNVKYFMNLVKHATGNIRDPSAEAKKGGPKPGKVFRTSVTACLILSNSHAYHQGRVELTTRAGYTDLRCMM